MIFKPLNNLIHIFMQTYISKVLCKDRNVSKS